jgi:hypothetical protein
MFINVNLKDNVIRLCPIFHVCIQYFVSYYHIVYSDNQFELTDILWTKFCVL